MAVFAHTHAHSERERETHTHTHTCTDNLWVQCSVVPQCFFSQRHFGKPLQRLDQTDSSSVVVSTANRGIACERDRERENPETSSPPSDPAP